MAKHETNPARILAALAPGELDPAVVEAMANYCDEPMVLVPLKLIEQICEGVRRAVQSNTLDARSMAADAALLLEAELRKQCQKS